jgi:ubiquinone/menaquinone biosynthesis C-methylase UbiE
MGLARRGAQVVGVDFSAAMLEVARERNSKDCSPHLPLTANRPGKPMAPTTRPHPQEREDHAPSFCESGSRGAQFIHGDALQIPFQDNTFDIVTVGYGLRNLASWERGLSEMARVAKPGGRLLALEFGKPPNALWRAIYFGYLRMFVPCLGRLICRDADAYAYILESLKQYPAQEGVAARMREMGLGEVRIVKLLGGVMSINYGVKARGGGAQSSGSAPG